MTNGHSSRNKDLRIVFAGTPAFASTQLLALINDDYQIVGVYSQPDRRTGRGKKLSPSPVKSIALEHNLPVYQPTSLRDVPAQDHLASLRPDLMIVAAYGLLLPQAILDIPRYGCINIHASLLPRWRGAAPIERAIEAGDTQSGITIMQMDAGLDTGAVLHTVTCPIDEYTTGDSLRQQLGQLAAPALQTTIQQLTHDQLLPQKQDEQYSCYADKLEKREAWLDWEQPAAALARKVRAFHSAHVACTNIEGERIKIWMAQHEKADADRLQLPGTIISSDKHSIRVACGEGILNIIELQMPGRKSLPVAAVLNSRQALFRSGQRFETPSDQHHGR